MKVKASAHGSTSIAGASSGSLLVFLANSFQVSNSMKQLLLYAAPVVSVLGTLALNYLIASLNEWLRKIRVNSAFEEGIKFVDACLLSPNLSDAKRHKFQAAKWQLMEDRVSASASDMKRVLESKNDFI